MRKLVIGASAALVAVGFLAAPAAQASNCGAVVVGEGVYLAHDANGSVNLWIYLEDNGVAGLQRGGNTVLLNEADTCQEGASNPDMAIL